MSYARVLDEVQLAFRQFGIIAVHIEDGEVDKALRTVNYADAVGFVVDPTAYRTALEDRRLERAKKLLELFRRTKNELREIFPE